MQWLRFCCGYISQARLSLSAARSILKLRRPPRMPALGHGNLGNDAAVVKPVPTSNENKRLRTAQYGSSWLHAGPPGEKQTPGNVKLLLPPRQSRGASLVVLAGRFGGYDCRASSCCFRRWGRCAWLCFGCHRRGRFGSRRAVSVDASLDQSGS